MKKPTWRGYIVPVITGLVAVASIVGIFALNANAEREPTPQRVLPTQTPQGIPTPPSTPEPTPTPAPTQEPLIVEGSNILHVSIPAVALEVAVSGETWPRETENCHGANLCIDPPVSNQAAWYGDVPSLPSQGRVRIFGHTSWSNPEYAAFNDLLAVKARDTIVVTTETGIFTYAADAPVLVPYSEVVNSELIWGDSSDTVVFVTCNRAENSGTVVLGHLISATAR